MKQCALLVIALFGAGTYLPIQETKLKKKTKTKQID